jgi:2,5-furandicarboxylate decarboxylase 1
MMSASANRIETTSPNLLCGEGCTVSTTAVQPIDTASQVQPNDLLLERDLIRKPVLTFRDHALSENAMPYQDFRQFLDVLRQQGELIDVDRPIALTDVGKALKQAYQKGRPAVCFNDNGTDLPLVCGVYSDRNKALLAFQADEKTILQKVLDGLDNPIAPRMVKGNAPCHEVVITGDDIDINRFPIPTYSPKDGGPYITPGIVVSKDPETGVPDIGHYRFLILGKDTFSFSAQPFHRFGKNLAKCQKMGVTPKAALIIGVDPILAYTCQVQVHDQTNDWEVAGACAASRSSSSNARPATSRCRRPPKW